MSSKEAPFWDHVRELGMRLKRILIAVFAATIFMMVFPADPVALIANPIQFLEMYEPIVARVLTLVNSYILPEGVKLIAGELSSPFEIWIVASILIGLLLSMPVVGYEIYAFVNPAFYPHERRLIYPFLTAFITLFFVGVAFALFFVLPALMRFLLIFAVMFKIEATITAISFYTMVFFTALATGMVFTFPVILILLIRVGIVGTAPFKKYRGYIYAFMYIVVAFITPDGGIAGNFILFIPLVVMFEVALIIGRRYEKQRFKELYGELKCKFCGAEISPDDVFCPKCNRALK
ncbi:MAG: twin-arginine translocase subunit TatC [Thaumarchaeota archaeon]|jgi:sec-independent protein translocase protein TatC|nr:twin-arginine translocase subunit TatC [Candidatus Terraquivivens yellowstonensis]